MGAALLTNASVLLAFALVVVVGLVQFRRAILQMNALAALSAMIVVSPWLIRNAMVLHSPVLRSNFGLELHVSNNELARANADDNLRGGAYKRYHPSLNPMEATRVREQGEIAYNERARTDAVSWIRHNPGAFLVLTIKRIGYFWFPDVKQRLAFAFDFLWILAAFAGLYIARPRNKYLVVGLISLWAGYSCVYSFVQSSVRYSYPIQWSLNILVAILAAQISLRIHLVFSDHVDGDTVRAARDNS